MTSHRCMSGIALVCFLLAAGVATAESGNVTTAQGVTIHYERYGSGSQAILIPGRLFMPEMRQLEKPVRTLVLYDMRNRGQSGRVADVAQINVMTDVADVEALRRHFGFEKVSLVGYSYLGLMVALYARDNPDRVERLVQIGPVPRNFTTAYPDDQTAGIATLSAEGTAAANAWRAIRNAASAGSDQQELCRAQGRFMAYLLVGNPANHTKVPDACVYENEHYANQGRHLEAHFGDLQKRDFAKEPFTKIKVPVLTVHGTLDRNASYGSGLEWATTFPNGRLITVAGGAHQVWLDDPAVVTDIDAFLGGKWPERAQAFGRE